MSKPSVESDTDVPAFGVTVNVYQSVPADVLTQLPEFIELPGFPALNVTEVVAPSREMLLAVTPLSTVVGAVSFGVAPSNVYVTRSTTSALDFLPS